MIGTPHDPKAANVRKGKGSNTFLGFRPMHDGATMNEITHIWGGGGRFYVLTVNNAYFRLVIP